MQHKNDFIEKMIEQAFEVLRKLLDVENPKKEEIEDMQIQLKDMYKNLLKKNCTYFYNEPIPLIVEAINKEYTKREFLSILEFLSELYFCDGRLQEDKNLKNMLFTKSLFLFNCLDKHSETYSLTRNNRIIEINKEIQTSI